MAHSVDVKARDFQSDYDPNDPLMELSRIMGVPMPSAQPKQIDPQINLEDSFSLDLERELALDEVPEVSLDLDDDIGSAFSDEVAAPLEMAALPVQAPVVYTPSLEDELAALLDDTPQVTLGRPTLEQFIDEPNVAPASEPWLDSELGEPLEMATGDAWAEPEYAAEPVYEPEYAEDPVIAEMNAVSKKSYEPTAPQFIAEQQYDLANFEIPDVGSDAVAEMADLELDFAEPDYAATPEYAVSEVTLEPEYAPKITLSNLPPAPEFEDWSAPAVEPVDEYEPELDMTSDFNRLLAETAPQPIVEALDTETVIVAAMDDLDIPDFDLAPEPAISRNADFDLEDDFSETYRGFEKPVATAAAHSAVESDSDIDFEGLLNDELSADLDDRSNGYVAGAAATIAGAAAYRQQSARYQNEIDDFESMPGNFEPNNNYGETAPRKQSWVLAAAVAAVALLGSAGYYAYSSNSTASTSGAPVLVKADTEPFKVAPETPGGKAVLNQDKAVYDKVAGTEEALPSQGQLISESEEPVDIASIATQEAVDPNAKSEARVDPALDPNISSGQAADTLAVSPKKVRTFVVKPDGTLVERPIAAPVAEATPVAAEVAAPEVAAPQIATSVAETQTAQVAPEQAAPVAEATPAVEPSAPVAEVAPEPVKAAPAIKVVKTKKIKAPVAEVEQSAATDAAPVIDQRPADQPVNIVGQTGGEQPAAETQVASADPAPVASGIYAVQIASTPSPEAAKSTYAALSRKFGGVIGGRGVNIQKADVAGKGTVYRVRIPAGSKQEANALCAQYKSAGGSCFISR